MPKRTDHNQREIVQALRDVGASVYSTHSVGHGFPDLVCAYKGQTYLIEVKAEHGMLTPDQEEFHLMWNATVHTVHNVDEALEVIGVWYNKRSE